MCVSVSECVFVSEFVWECVVCVCVCVSERVCMGVLFVCV